MEDSVGADMAVELLSMAAVTRRALARVGGRELVCGVGGLPLARFPSSLAGAICGVSGANEMRAGRTRI